MRSIRAVLTIFEQVSSLKVNFHKSMLTGVNVSASWLTEAASALHCRVGSLPFVFLGLPIGGDARRLEFWKHVVDRILTRLLGWKSRFSSLGGCLILLREVGGGSSTYFWTDNWVGGIPLRHRFPRLFDLTTDRWVTVEEMGRRGWEEGGAAWVWRRHLLAWEEESVLECSVLLHDVILQDHVDDRWRWSLDPINGYSVKGTYRFLTIVDSLPNQNLSVDVWLKQVPLKVSLFAWRLFL